MRVAQDPHGQILNARSLLAREMLDQLSPEARAALRRLPLRDEDTSGPLGRGLLSRGVLATNIRAIQAGLG
ncbi:hypothetical protein GCM10009816_08310 [Microbacterium aquimaris]